MIRKAAFLNSSRSQKAGEWWLKLKRYSEKRLGKVDSAYNVASHIPDELRDRQKMKTCEAFSVYTEWIKVLSFLLYLIN